MLQEGAIAGGRFRLVRPIGQGGMASVWWARDEHKGGEVAIKITTAGDPERTGRFLREARIIGRFDHPNIVKVIEAGELEDEDCLFMAMELLRGSPLSDRLESQTTLPTTEALAILIEVCRGLEVAHGAGVIHRDIKPENIFLAVVPGRGVVPKILDFGVSTGGERRSMPRLSISGQVLGTPGYMCPEQAMGRPDLTPSADLWAVGVVLYESVAGKLPFFGKTAGALLDSIVSEEPGEVPASVDDHTRAIIARCFQKNPAHRYPDAGSLRADMERALEVLRAQSDETPEPTSSRRSGPPIDPSLIIAAPPTSRPPRAQRQALARPKSPLLIAPFAVALCVAAVFVAPRRKVPALRCEAGLADLAKSRAARVVRPAASHSAGGDRAAP